MKVELRKVKIARHLSEETTAFTADLWVDGKHIGHVKNSGHGGNNQVDHRYDGKGLNTRDEVRAFETWCREQPPHVSEYGESPMSDDFYISLLLEEWEETRQIKRMCKTKILVRYEGEEDFRVFHVRWPEAKDAQLAIMSQLTKQVHPQVIVEFVNKRFI
tara:strand:- start:2 stop:481 length:480 start_codon:yes stop_codon:yes gene_type:complete